MNHETARQHIASAKEALKTHREQYDALFSERELIITAVYSTSNQNPHKNIPNVMELISKKLSRTVDDIDAETYAIMHYETWLEENGGEDE